MEKSVSNKEKHGWNKKNFEKSQIKGTCLVFGSGEYSRDQWDEIKFQRFET